MCTTLDLIDDDEAIRHSLGLLLELCGYTVRTHASAEAFLNVFTKSDCLLVDHNMPGMTGLQLLEHLRAIDDFTPALIISGQPNEAMRWRAQQIHVPVLSKPLEEATLVAAIKDVCKRSRPTIR